MTDTDSVRAALGERYAIERELGRGGSSTVYLAQDLRGGHDVALKVLSPELVGPSAWERFALEIRVTGDLDHPNILPLVEAGRSGDISYFTMPFVEGASLQIGRAHV